jgi:hypothetical protein
MTSRPKTSLIQVKMPDQDLSLGVPLGGNVDVSSVNGGAISYDGQFWTLAPGFYRLHFHGQFFNFPDPDGSIVVQWKDDAEVVIDQCEVRPDSSTTANQSSLPVLDVVYFTSVATRVRLVVIGAQPALGPKIVPNAVGSVASVP